MQQGQELGRIDCPHCGTQNGMLIKADKNLEPFGFCDMKCRGQLRVGGNGYRVGLFRGRYRWADPAAEKPVTVTEPQAAEKPVTVTETKTETKPKKTDALGAAVAFLAGKK